MAMLLTPAGQTHLLRPAATAWLSQPDAGRFVFVERVSFAWWRPTLSLHNVEVVVDGATHRMDELTWKGWDWRTGPDGGLRLGVLVVSGVDVDLSMLLRSDDSQAKAPPFTTEDLPFFRFGQVQLNDITLRAGDWQSHWAGLVISDGHHAPGAPLRAKLQFDGLSLDGPDSLWVGQVPMDTLAFRMNAQGPQWQLEAFQVSGLGLRALGQIQWDGTSRNMETHLDLNWAPRISASHFAAHQALSLDSMWATMAAHPATEADWTGHWSGAWNFETATGHLQAEGATGPMGLGIEQLRWEFPSHSISANLHTTAAQWLPFVGKTGLETLFPSAEIHIQADENQIDLLAMAPGPNAAEIVVQTQHAGWPDLQHPELKAHWAWKNLSPQGLSFWPSGESTAFTTHGDMDLSLTLREMRMDGSLTAQEGDGSVQQLTFSAQAPTFPNWTESMPPGWRADWTANMVSDAWPLALSGQWTNEGDAAWTAQTDVQLKGVRPLPRSEMPIFGSASLSIGRVSHGAIAGQQRWEGRLEMRDLNFVTEERPIRIDRFDAFGHWNGRHADLQWASDLGHGHARGDGRIERWWDWLLAEEHRDNQVPVPQASAAITLTNVRPLAALTGWPVDIAPGTQFEWASSGTDNLFHGKMRCDWAQWSPWRLDGFFLDLTGQGDELFITTSLDSLRDVDRQYAVDLHCDVHADSVWTLDVNWLGITDAPSSIRMQLHEPERNLFEAEVFALDFPVYGLPLSLQAPFPVLRYDLAQGLAELPHLTFNTGAGSLTFQPFSTRLDDLDLRLQWTEPHLPGFAGAPWATAGLGTTGPISLSIDACGSWPAPELSARAEVNQWASPAGNIQQLQAAWHGDLSGGALMLEVQEKDQTVLGAIGHLQSSGELAGSLSFRAMPTSWLNPVLQAGSVSLDGPLAGHIDVNGSLQRPALSGTIRAENVKAHIGYLGSSVSLTGDIDIEEDAIAFDNLALRDAQGQPAQAIGTILHDEFAAWNFDISLDMNKAPFQLMNLRRTDNDLFYGQAFVQGWGNVSGSAADLQIEANLTTAAGTQFVLPMDRVTTPSYADFIQFKSPQAAANVPEAESPVELAQVRLKLGLDVREDAETRIIFNEAIGDEIVGRTRGHLDLTINDFERFEMSGALEVVEGYYNLALSGLVQKRFVVDPGGTITWIRDPYGAAMDLVARYTVRTSLDNLLVGTTDLPGRLPVDLRLNLKGALLRPDISFDVELPRANPQLQALVDNALFDEDEKNRQAISLLALGQFMSQDPNVPLISDVSLAEQSTALLTAQLGNWLSSLAKGVDVGLNYGSSNLSGEQEVAVALSTQFLDDRLHIEGEARGTTPGAAVSQADVQLQDLRIAYDITEDGRLQISGYRETAPGWNGLDGATTTGIGIRFREQFDRWKDLLSKENP